jgi:hypothetical protein
MAADDLGGLMVWFGWVPLLVVGLVAWAVTGIRLLRWPWQRWWWTIAAPPVLAMVLLVGVVSGGPVGATRERAAGWAVVSVAIYAGSAVLFGRRVSTTARTLALTVALGAAPTMVCYDHMSQYRWRKAELARVPSVVPVIAGFRVTAVRGDGAGLAGIRVRIPPWAVRGNHWRDAVLPEVRTVDCQVVAIR